MNKQCVNCPGRTDHTTAECWVRASLPDGYMPIPTAEQLADALENVRCFHDMSAELIAPELLANLLASTTVKAEQVDVCDTCHGQGEVYSGHDQHFHYFDFQPPEPIMEVCPECGGEEAPSLPADQELLALVDTRQSAHVSVDLGIKAAVNLIEKKAADYAMEQGHDDMGGLSFGSGPYAQIKADYHSGLLELADELRALLNGGEA